MTFRCPLFFVLVFFTLWENKHVLAMEKEMTISIDPRKVECFYQSVQKGQVIDVEYQVIGVGIGEPDINFRFTSPSKKVIVSEFKKSDNSHRTEATEDGDYEMCWDNTFSHISRKTVYFEILIENEDEETESWDIDFDNYDSLTPEELYDMKLQDIQDAITRVRGHLNKIRHLQDSVRAFEARDRNIAESNFFRVNTWSIIQIIMMIAVGIIQLPRQLGMDSYRFLMVS